MTADDKPKAERQELFDRICRGLIKQGEPAERNDQCLYRTPDGRACAIGQIIPDDKYSPEIEGLTIFNIPLQAVLTDLGYREHLAFLAQVQRAHDKPVIKGLRGKEWLSAFAEHMRKLASKYDLNPEILTEIK